MHAVAPLFTEPENTPRWRRWFFYSPYARLVILLAIVAVVDFLILKGLALFGTHFDRSKPLVHPFIALCITLVPLFAYVIVVRLIERRRISELSLGALPSAGVAGLGLGCTLMSMTVGILWLTGSYHVTGFNPDVNWLPGLLLFGLGAGIGEEILFRGGLFRLLEEGLGTWWALIASALFFGLAHIANPGASVADSAAIATEAGLLLGLAYIATRSLWFCIGLHMAWNVMEGLVFGIPVSGNAGAGLLVSQRTGPAWLSGGQFGAEGSIIALAVCLAASLLLLRLARKRGAIIPPSWQRRYTAKSA